MRPVVAETTFGRAVVWKTVEGRRIAPPIGSLQKEDAVVADAIERIKEAEARADEARRQGRAEKKRAVAEAHEASEKLLDETRRAAREAEREAVESARAEAEREAERIAAEGRERVEMVRTAAEANVEAGVVKVLSSITAEA